MPLESHSAEAKDLLAAVLTVTLYQPQHWYSPSLPQDHPSSFCCLFGLTHEELNLVLKVFGFHSLVFDDYLQQHQGLSSIESCKSSHASLTPRTQHVYLVGKSNGKTLVQSFTKQISNNTLPPPIDENNAHQIALKMFARTIAKEETSGASHGECQNTNQNHHDGTDGCCLNPLTTIAGSAANKMRNTDPELGNKVGVNSNAITPHPPTANQLSVK
jgi:hypothetical protein